MTFDPDKFITKMKSKEVKKPSSNKSFDPDAFIKSKGFQDKMPENMSDKDYLETKGIFEVDVPEDKTFGQRFAKRTADIAGPAIEGAGGIAGAVVGAGSTLPTGPGAIAGGAAGAGLGYAAGAEVVDLLRQYAGDKKQGTLPEELTDAARNALTGATYEVGGPVVMNMLGKTASLLNPMQFVGTSKRRAANIVKDSLGDKEQVVRNMLKEAPDNLTAGEAVTSVNVPEFQALVESSLKRKPAFIDDLMENRKSQAVNALSDIAGGANQTAARESAELARRSLGDATEPVKQAALNRANMGRDVARFEQQAVQQGNKAADSVQDVRRFEAAGQRAPGIQAEILKERYPNVPYAFNPKDTYVGGELVERANKMAAEAAEGSLDFGNAARANESVASVLRSRGIEPLSPDKIMSQMSSMMQNPSYAGNRKVKNVLNQVGEDLKQWTDNNGIIDAVALDAIRKNSVNAAVMDLYPNADVKLQKEIAAKLLTELKPTIIRAVEKSGGKGYADYLKAYEKGAQAVNQGKLGARALELFQSSPEQFVKLVEGNATKEVEKIFGSGSYNILKEMSEASMNTMRSIADVSKRSTKAASDAISGRDALKEILNSNLSKIRLPRLLDRTTVITNKALEEVQSKLDKKTLDILTEGLKSGKKADQLLQALPEADRVKLMNVLSSTPGLFQPVNALIQDRPPEPTNNYLAR